MANEKMIDAATAAEMLKVHRMTVYRMIRRGELSAKRLGQKNWLISLASVEKLKLESEEIKK